MISLSLDFCLSVENMRGIDIPSWEKAFVNARATARFAGGRGNELLM